VGPGAPAILGGTIDGPPAPAQAGWRPPRDPSLGSQVDSWRGLTSHVIQLPTFTGYADWLAEGDELLGPCIRRRWPPGRVTSHRDAMHYGTEPSASTIRQLRGHAVAC